MRVGEGETFIMRLRVAAAAFLFLNFTVHAYADSLPEPRVGDRFELSRLVERSQESSDGSNGTSHDQDTLIERVIAVRDGGLELEFDLPAQATAEARAADWHFPVRVFKPSRGPMRLLNRDELATRVDRWLQSAGMTRAACGHWIFTWNAFRIECDPDSVTQILEQFDPRPDELREGAMHRDPLAGALAPMNRRQVGSEAATFVVEAAVDPAVVLREKAESDRALAEIMGHGPGTEAQLPMHSDQVISGTITVTFYPNAEGEVGRRTRLIRIETRGPAGRTETNTSTETLERRRIVRQDS
jgi:hypothetical protein